MTGITGEVSQQFIARIKGLSHKYGNVIALANVNLNIPAASTVGFIGPDGVGKSTLLGIIAGVCKIQQGSVTVIERDISAAYQRAAICPRIAYMPQGLGQNLYSDLSVAENITFFGRLFNLEKAQMQRHMKDLLTATGLSPFVDRPAGELSGGMKQKLGLCCALIHDPDLLILDEPTSGIDPLSRLQFWGLVGAMRQKNPWMSVLVATSNMNEAEQFDRLIMMDAGRVLSEGSPSTQKEKTGASTLDEAYISLLPPEKRKGYQAFSLPPPAEIRRDLAVEAVSLTRRFGNFTAVDRVTFSITRGEIFGFVGPNGSGKTTAMKMIIGLLPPSGGEVKLFGKEVKAGDRDLRRLMGYMSQSFSLYGELSVLQNLELHARLFDVPQAEVPSRIKELIEHFGLEDVKDMRAEELPLGIRQRLSLAVAVIHEPELLILDEPTSGVDLVARDLFWRLIVELSREKGTTIFVSTHYLYEAMRCDRVALMNTGRILACASPDELIKSRNTSNIEEAFISYIVEDQGHTSGFQASELTSLQAQWVHGRDNAPRYDSSTKISRQILSVHRLWTLAYRETLEVWRDPFRMFSAFFVPVALMLIFGFGLSMDIENLPFAALDYDNTPQSRSYLEQFVSSRYFDEHPPATSDAEVERRLQSGEIRMAVEIPSGFGKELKRGKNPEVGIWIDGTMPYRGETALGYAKGVHLTFLKDLARRNGHTENYDSQVGLETRFWFNESLKSKYSFVPGLVAVILMLIPAMLTAAAVVREKELGSITNLYATPVTRLEFLWGKQIPYALISFLNFLILTLLVVAVFGIPLKGSLTTLTLGALIFVFASTGFGLLVSTFTRTQVAAVLIAMILVMIPSFQYSGLLSPVSALEGGSFVFGRSFPTTYFLNISVGTFTKGLGFFDLLPNYIALIVLVVVIYAICIAFLNKQRA
ncbi:MAG TPA: ribosome-associated ATPase/putative transporter RbbA [Thermodesulfobacteriota bacterium]|nr:ribosome-associated ATPase/putative transporter RbbA [Thermodesulfobacteriota bacterium]